MMHSKHMMKGMPAKGMMKGEKPKPKKRPKRKKG